MKTGADGGDLEIGKLPVLRLVEIDSLLLHEEADPARAVPLARRIRSDGFLRNPPIAARDHGAASHILLDGANRVEALRQLGARFAVIQEVDLADRQVALTTWHHVLEGLRGHKMVRGLASCARVAILKGTFTREGDFLPRFGVDVTCYIILPGRETFAVLGGRLPANRLNIVTRVAAVAAGASNRDRVSYTNVNDLARNYPRFSALICYRAFSKQQVLRLAIAGGRFPSGITRFSVPKRALALSVPLGLLTQRGAARAKQGKLDQMIRRAIESKKIRFYEEPTFYFND